MQQIIDIKNLVKYEENNRIEAKRAKGGLPNSIWETYSAFANTEGGVILLGVDERDDHTLVATGVEDAHKMMTDLWNILNNKQKVSLNILTERMVATHEVEGKTVISIEVPKADRHHRPIHIGSDPMRGTYRRSFEGDYLCTKDEVAAMYRDASDVSIDLKVLHAMDMTVFDMDTVHRYRNRFAQFHPTHIWNDDDDELFLRRIGAIALSEVDMAFHPTCAGLLMFGHEYDIERQHAMDTPNRVKFWGLERKSVRFLLPGISENNSRLACSVRDKRHGSRRQYTYSPCTEGSALELGGSL